MTPLTTAMEARAWGMLPTPFTADLAHIDHGSLRSLVKALRGQGVEGFVALGVIGEPETLSPGEKQQVMDTVITAAGGCPVVATSIGVARSPREQDMSMFGSLGTALSAVMMPVSSPDPATLRHDVDRAATISGLPIMLQDYPQSTGIHIELTDLVDVVAHDSRIIAVKEEAPPTFHRIAALRSARCDLHLVSGSGGVGIVEDIVGGADAIACQATPANELCKAAEQARAGKVADARETLGRVAALINYEVQARSSIAIRKAHWHRMGIIANPGVRGDRLIYSSQMSAISDSFGIPESPR